MVQEAPTLAFFDEKRSCLIQCDASQYGLGACLMQEGKPVAYASRSLTGTETSYAQIEKECLAIVFGLQRFEQFIHGRNDVLVETDHKPLESIFKKPIVSAPRRLQRMLLRLQRYNFNVIYRPGKSIVIADFLSRAPLQDTQGYKIDEALIFQNEIEEIEALNHINITDERIKEVQEETKLCPMMAQLAKTINEGWPEKKGKLSDDLKQYWNIRDELTTAEGLVLKGERLVIPAKLRPSMLQKLHSSHQGIESSLRRAREVMFWPGMTKDIKSTVEKCWPCQKYASSKKRTLKTS